MLQALTLLFLCQLAGEVMVQALGLTFPGPVLGMGLLFGGLPAPAAPARPSTRWPTPSCGACRCSSSRRVGVIQQAGLIAANWLAISAGLVLSTIADARRHRLHLPRRRADRGAGDRMSGGSISIASGSISRRPRCSG